jgi:hypothetical protein
MANRNPVPVELSGRELATVLAALRYWQLQGLMSQADAIHKIASDGGRHKPMKSDQIDRLCERINLDCETDKSF